VAERPLEVGLLGGREKRPIEIVEYDIDWPARFERHAVNIRSALGVAALKVEHIGSTSVPSLAAKPIVDILLVVQSAADESAYVPLMESAGYVLRVREPDFEEHRMFRTPERDVHVHVFSIGAREIGRYLAFRDRLSKNADDRQRYEETKRRLAALDWPDMDAYARAKTHIVEQILAAASASDERAR
jgi:GrpB-like predicted nucleotidyltransferase (UPF0157 family)